MALMFAALLALGTSPPSGTGSATLANDSRSTTSGPFTSEMLTVALHDCTAIHVHGVNAATLSPALSKQCANRDRQRGLPYSAAPSARVRRR